MENPFEILNAKLDFIISEIAIIRQEISKSKTEQMEQNIVSTPELREVLGISEVTLYRLRKNRKIPFIKTGAHYKYDLNAVLKALGKSK